MSETEDTFARLVSLAVHDLRTPLATVSGFARTLERADLGDPTDRYVGLMVAACDQLAELLEEVGLAARIEGDRWEPNLQEDDSARLAAAAAESLEGAEARGEGGTVRVDRDAAIMALRLLANCARRHGALERVTLDADGTAVAIGPVTPDSARVLTLEELRDLGAAVAAKIVRALGGTIELRDERLVVTFGT
jgi:signal transduction histidine kinase